MPDRSTDEAFLRRALELARQGIALASPNPHVGAVIVDSQGEVAGTGVYTYAGKIHAEIIALRQAGERARGATLYINLEPHAHQGRTPPCTDALIDAGIGRVVACMPDPNPKVSGRGFAQLRAARIEVEVGGLEAEGRRLNQAFARFTRSAIPLVILKSAMTLDGKIAASTNSLLPVSQRAPDAWITGEAARAQVQQQRHESDAILTGIGTILADDPLLTDRAGKPRRRSLLRVVLDSRLRLPVDSRIVKSVKAGTGPDLLVFCCSCDEKKRHELETRGVQVEQVRAGGDGRPDLHSVLRRLGELGITSLLVEGGAAINSAFLASEIPDKVFFYYAPKIFGDKGVAFANAVQPRQDVLRNVHFYRFGEDVAIEGDLRDVYAEGNQ